MFSKSSWILRFGLPGAACLIAVLLSPLRCGADELADKGREVFKKYHRSVITVQIVVKSKFSMGGMGGQSNESRQDVTGTLIDPSGLTVLSLAATDPGQMMQNVIAGMSEDDSKIKLETELSDVKLLLQDGTEVPAEVVLRELIGICFLAAARTERCAGKENWFLGSPDMLRDYQGWSGVRNTGFFPIFSGRQAGVAGRKARRVGQ